MAILPLFIDIWYVLFIKTLIIMSISTNIYRPYMCDPIRPYISLANNCTNPITSYCSTFINYLHQHIDQLIKNGFNPIDRSELPAC